MVFPIETENRTIRNLVMLTQDITRLSVEAFRKALQILDEIVKNETDRFQIRLKELKEVIKEADNEKLTLINEIQKTGGVLVNRVDFIRLISTFNDIIDHIEAIALRISKIGLEQWKIPNNISDGLTKMSVLSFQAITELREAVMSLGFDTQKSLKFIQKVNETERNLDLLYVDVDFEIITSSIDLPLVLILRDVASLLERLVDYIQTAADLVHIIGI